MVQTELTHAEQIVFEHIQLCNKHLGEGHRMEKPFLFNFKIGDLVTSINCKPRDLIGAIHGYIYSPFTQSYRAVLDVNCDVEITNIKPANQVEELTYNLHTKDFKPVEARMTVFYK
jgi:hypothetical protein